MPSSPGMALELDAGNRIFTTLPVVEVNRGRAGEAALDFAHFANGASIVSAMVFMISRRSQAVLPSAPFIRPFLRPVLSFTFTIRRVIPSTRHCWWISREIWRSPKTEP